MLTVKAEVLIETNEQWDKISEPAPGEVQEWRGEKEWCFTDGTSCSTSQPASNPTQPPQWELPHCFWGVSDGTQNVSVFTSAEWG